MNLFLCHRSAIQFWLSARAHRARVDDAWRRLLAGKAAGHDGVGADQARAPSSTDAARGLRPLAPLNYRCILAANAEKLEAEYVRSMPASLARNRALADALAAGNVDFASYRKPYLKDVLDAGSERFSLMEVGANHVPSLTRDAAEQLKARYGLTGMLECAVSQTSNRRHNSWLRAHVHPARVPKTHYAPIAAGLAVASPELTLYMASRTLEPKKDMAEMIALCSKFFAVYILDDQAPYGILRRQAITTPQRCLAFLGHCGCERAKFHNFLKHAISYAAQDNASPLEMAGSILAKTPCFRWGYGLGKVECNYEVDTSKAFRDGNRHYRLVDSYFPAAKVAVEFKGRGPHADDRIALDAAREAELRAVGVSLVSASRKQFLNFDATEKFMVETLARMVHRRDMRALEKYAVGRRQFCGELMTALSKDYSEE